MLDSLHDGELETARNLCERALQQNPEDSKWLLALSWCYLGAGRGNRALRLALRAAEHEPNSGLIFRTIASIYLHHDRLDEALVAAEHALRLDPCRSSKELIRAIRRKMPMPARGKQQGRRAQPAADTRIDQDGDRVRRPTPLDPNEATGSEELDFPSELRTRADVWSNSSRSQQLLGRGPPDLQLAALYGESLFGAWRATISSSTGSIVLRKLRPSRRAQLFVLAPFLLLAGALAVGAWGVLEKAGARERAAVAGRMQQLTRGGNVEQLAELFDDPAVADEAFVAAGGKHHATWRRADATLYRYYDASPTRRERLTRLAPSGTGAFETVTRALLRSAPERAGIVARLDDAARSADDPSAALLWAQALARDGNHAGARRGINKALDREPTHLVLLATLAELLGRARAGRRADEVLAEMDDIRPRASWTRIAHLRVAISLRRRLPAEPPPVPGVHAPVLTGGVAAAERAFAAAIAAHRQGASEAAAAAMATVADALHHEPSFLVDFADRALATGTPKLAQALTETDGWPSDSAAAGSVVGRLLAERGLDDLARQRLSAAWRAGLRDPLVARSLARLLAGAETAELTVDAVNAEIATLFRGRTESTSPRKRRTKRGQR